jgi:hypothetical protein
MREANYSNKVEENAKKAKPEVVEPVKEFTPPKGGPVLACDCDYFPEDEGSGDGKTKKDNATATEAKALPDDEVVKYLLASTSVPIGIIQAGFDAAREIQPSVNTYIKGAKIFGRTSNFLGGISIAFDFYTGTANTSTIMNGGVMIGSAIAFGALGLAAAPYIAGFGVVYGISSLVFEKPLNEKFDISKRINFVTPKK